MDIYLTRHGETQWNIEGRTQGIQDTSLTEKGIQQAEILGARLEREGLSQIFTSDLERASQTAEIIGQRTKHTPIKSKELREVCFGMWEGLTLKDIEKGFPGQLDQWHRDPEFSPQDGESIRSVQARIKQFLETSIYPRIHEDLRVLVVSHALTSKLLLVELLDISVHHLWSFRQDNTGVSIIRLNQRQRTAVCINDTCHLSPQ